MMRTAFLALGLAMAGGSGWAQCVTQNDLGRGVVVTFDTGDRTITRARGDGVLQVDETYLNGAPTRRFLARHGVYFLEEFEVAANGGQVPGTRLVIEFPLDPARLPLPAPGTSWTGQTVNVFEDGATRAETTTIAFSDAPDITLGACTYEAVQADLRYDWGAEGGLTLSYLYLPAVGAAVLMSNQFDGGERITSVPVDLAVLRK